MRQRPEYARTAPDRLVLLARSVHRLMQQMLVVDEGDSGLEADLDWARQTTDEISERIARHGRGPDVRLGSRDEAEGARPYYVSGALVGPHHPMFPPIEIETVDGVTRGTISFDVVWEGPPGCVHGGYVAYLHDCIMGHHNHVSGIPAMTARLKIRYRRPTPLYKELRFEVRTAKLRGRKVVTQASVRDGDRVLTEAEGLFVQPQSFLANLRRE